MWTETDEYFTAMLRLPHRMRVIVAAAAAMLVLGGCATGGRMKAVQGGVRPHRSTLSTSATPIRSTTRAVFAAWQKRFAKVVRTKSRKSLAAELSELSTACPIRAARKTAHATGRPVLIACVHRS